MSNREQFHRDIKAFLWVILLYSLILLLFAKSDIGLTVAPITQKITLDLKTFKETPIESDPLPPPLQEVVKQDEPIEPEPIKPQPPEPQEVVVESTPPIVTKKIDENLTQKDTSITKKPEEKKTLAKQKKKTTPSKQKNKSLLSKEKNTNTSSQKKGGNASSAQNSLFLASLKRKINQAKSYPPIAKRMGATGSVVVSFTINSSGKPTNIQLSGPKVFHASAKNAVLGAFPISPNGAKLPMEISFTLSYSIAN